MLGTCRPVSRGNLSRVPPWGHFQRCLWVRDRLGDSRPPPPVWPPHLRLSVHGLAPEAGAMGARQVQSTLVCADMCSVLSLEAQPAISPSRTACPAPIVGWHVSSGHRLCSPGGGAFVPLGSCPWAAPQSWCQSWHPLCRPAPGSSVTNPRTRSFRCRGPSAVGGAAGRGRCGA